MPSIFRAISASCLALSAGAVVTTDAFAQPVELEVRGNRDFEHDWTAMEFPARIDEFKRNRVIQFEERQANIAATYWDDETETLLSIYIYRPANPEPAIWFDRAMYSLGAHGVLGAVNQEDVKVGTFTPTGGIASSGQFAVLSVEGDFRSTAVAMYRAGEWLVKLRVSSQKLGVAGMDAMLRQRLAGLPALENVSGNPAYFVEMCRKPRSDEDATQIETDASAAMEMSMAATLSILARDLPEDDEEGATEPASAPPVYCREGERGERFNTYRPDESLESYFMAVGDSGFGITVAPNALQALLSDDPDAAATYNVTSATGLETSVHASFTGVPSQRQAAAAAFRGGRAAAISRPLGDEAPGIQVFMDTQEES